MDHLLRASRQTHGEHGLCLVGPPFDRAVMGLGNFARNIQPESETAPVFALLIRASRQWVKNPLQRLLVNDGTAVPDFKTNFRVMTRCYNADWPVRRAVPYRIDHQIRKQLLQARTVPNTLQVPLQLKIDAAVRMSCAQLVHRVAKHGSQIDVGRSNVDTQPKFGTVEIAQIIQECVHADATSNQSGCGFRYLMPGVQCRQMCRSRLDGLQRTAHIVPKHSEQQIASLLYLRIEKIHRFRDCLIDRLVKPDHVVRIRGDRLTFLYPQTQDAGAQRAVLSDHLSDVEIDTAGATSSSMIADWAVGISEDGMPAIRRLSDEFDVWSAPGAGAVLRVVLWSDAPPHGPAAAAAMTGGVPVEYGAINLALRGQVVSGDAWACTQGVEGFTVMIADGLGHGLLAHSAAVAAIGSLSPGSGAPLPEIISVADRALRPTVGAALGVARLPPRAVLPDPGDPGADSDQRGTAFSRADSVARFCGIGNVAASVWSAAAHRHLVSHAGIVGRGIRKTQEFDGAWSPGALLVMHSDGLNTRWDLARYPGLSVSHPSLIAAVLYRDHSREDDDLTVLVARDRRTPA